ncbi:MAG: hypothetical protein A3F16_00015 [Deltaproteobacteria bacterium RIFCSPHIGHO2_12_FULL_43_9]|nr:MAG: hypothetical protein A3F16_00015 [Deltaproteobacteria bacterium RIFCSPHIGHO2_12_FULL_43_9]
MRLASLILSLVLIPSITYAYRVIEHPSRQFVLLEDRIVPGTDHKASELLDEKNVPDEVHSVELIREAGDQSIDATLRLNNFYFAAGDARHSHTHGCMHHEYPHQQCTERSEFCWTDYEDRCGYEWEYICRYYNGQRYCRYEQVYRCRRYPVRRCIWQDIPVTYYELHSHQGELPFFSTQTSYPVKVIFPNNAPLAGNRTERFTVEFDGENPTIRFDHVAYFYSVDRIEVGDVTTVIWLKATSRQELMDPNNITFTLDDKGSEWSWIVEDQIYGVADVKTTYHLKAESCFLVVCDKPIEHYVYAPFELFTPPLRNNAVWSVTLEIERSGKFLPTPLKFNFKYEYKDGGLRPKN